MPNATTYPPFDHPADIADIWVAAWNRRDPDRLAALFDEEAEFVNVTGLWWHDREAIRKAHDYGLREIFGQSRLTLVDREGHLLNVEVTEGQRQELAVYKKLMNNGAVKNPWGRPKLRPGAVVGDKGFNPHWVQDWNHCKHMASVIPKHDSQTTKGPFPKDLYRERNLVERTIGRLKEFRRVAFRVEKFAEHHEANWLVAEIVRSLSDLEQPLWFSNRPYGPERRRQPTTASITASSTKSAV